MTVDREWLIAPVWPGCDEAAVKLGISPVIAQVLYNRGIEPIEEARSFLEPKLNGLSDPDEYEDLALAAETIAGAIADGRKMVVYSDYDVDGICGAAILWHLIKRAGGSLEVYIPHRVDEGYGLNIDAVNTLADQGCELMITVDCGIRAHEAVDQANRRGMQVVVTDHHEQGEDLPAALAVVHPARKIKSSAWSEVHINPCGAAVAFKLSWAVAKELSGASRVSEDFREHLVELTALVAMATVADVVPLLGENRILTKFGLEQLSRTKLVGLRALLDSVRLTGRIETHHVAFVIGPRINAAGRMGDAREALELLTVADCERAAELADHLEKQNRRRRKLEDQITAEAIELAEYQGQVADNIPILVLAKKDWHVGVIGIVASKLLERFSRPVIMIGLEGDRGQGSARSVEGYDINQALHACRQFLVGYGGHAMAAGLQIESGKIIPFMQALQRHASEHFSDRPHRPSLRIDARIGPSMLDGNLLAQLQKLAPFGQGNPRPVFTTEIVELVGEPKIVGNSGTHLSFSVRWEGRIFRAIAFGQSDACDPLRDARRCRLAFEPIADDFAGPGAIQLRVKAIKPII